MYKRQKENFRSYIHVNLQYNKQKFPPAETNNIKQVTDMAYKGTPNINKKMNVYNQTYSTRSMRIKAYLHETSTTIEIQMQVFYLPIFTKYIL